PHSMASKLHGEGEREGCAPQGSHITSLRELRWAGLTSTMIYEHRPPVIRQGVPPHVFNPLQKILKWLWIVEAIKVFGAVRYRQHDFFAVSCLRDGNSVAIFRFDYACDFVEST
ncbi:MAG: hypothetical protein KDA17_06835, partial [Candidatus Saccharibacteria bacterium]|nr:hypothetical protein [Candidatus Saccharibacteria bacterium]